MTAGDQEKRTPKITASEGTGAVQKQREILEAAIKASGIDLSKFVFMEQRNEDKIEEAKRLSAESDIDQTSAFLGFAAMLQVDAKECQAMKQDPLNTENMENIPK